MVDDDFLSLYQRFNKDLENYDKSMQILQGVNGHLLLNPKRNIAFINGKALANLDSETELFEALKKSCRTDYKTILKYLTINPEDRKFRIKQVAADSFLINGIGCHNDVSAGLAGVFSAERMKQMEKTIAREPDARINDAFSAFPEFAGKLTNVNFFLHKIS